MNRILLILHQVIKEVNLAYFDFLELPTINISKGKNIRYRKAIVFGTYNVRKNEILIHPVLLSEMVPRFALEFIVYHEMLHYEDRHKLLSRKKGEKVHTSEFRRREQQFTKYHQAQYILKKILYGDSLEEEVYAEDQERGLMLEDKLKQSIQRLDDLLSRIEIK